MRGPRAGAARGRAKPPPSAGPGAQLAAVQAHALAHADQAVARRRWRAPRRPGRRRAPRARARRGAQVDAHARGRAAPRACARWSAPPARSGRRTGPAPARARRGSPVDRERHVDAGPARVLDELAELAEPGLRARARPPSPSSRSTPSRRRISSSASSAERRIVRSGARASSGSRSSAASAASAWIAITLTPCATTSCSSRAIRAALLGHGRVLGPLALALEVHGQLGELRRLLAQPPHDAARRPSAAPPRAARRSTRR